MTTVVEPVLAIEWVYSVLSGDATLMAMATGGVWTDTAPEGTSFPRVQIQSQAASPDLVTPDGGRLVWATPILVVKAIDKGTTYALISPIAARAYDLLQNQEAVVTGGTIVSCIRDFAVMLPQNDGAVQYRTILQQFRIEAFSS